MIIASDIDGVLCDVIEPLILRLNKLLNVSMKPDEVKEWEFEVALGRYGVKKNHIRKIFGDEWFWGEGVPVVENIKWLRQWSQDHEIHLITGRHSDLGIPTRAWLVKNDVPFTKIIHSHTLHKFEYLEKVKADVLFEDNFYEANRCASDGIPAFVIRRSYNEDLEPRVVNPLVKFIDSFEEADSFIQSYTVNA